MAPSSRYAGRIENGPGVAPASVTVTLSVPPSVTLALAGEKLSWAASLSVTVAAMPVEVAIGNVSGDSRRSTEKVSANSISLSSTAASVNLRVSLNALPAKVSGAVLRV